MKLFLEAKTALTVGQFDRDRCSQAVRLYAKASGEERIRIAQLLESQYALAKAQEDVDWLNLEVRKAQGM